MAVRVVKPIWANRRCTSRSRPSSPPNRCATPLTSRRSAPVPSIVEGSPSTSTKGDQRPVQRASRSINAASPAGSAGTATSAGSSARASVSRAPGRAPRSAAAFVTAWMIGPCVPSTVRTTGSSGPKSLDFAQRSIASAGNQMEAIRFMTDGPPARRKAARPEQFGIPGRHS